MHDGAQQPPSSPLPEEEHFEIVLALEPGDRELFMRERGREGSGCLSVVLALVGVYVVLVVVFDLAPFIARSYGFEFPRYAHSLVLTVGLVVVVAVSWRLAARLTQGKGVRDTDGWFLATMTDGLLIRTRREESVHPWASFTSMIVSDSAIYLDLKGEGTLMLPARVVGDRNDFYTFVSVMAKYAGV
jgi:hypothetical protein